MNPKGKSFGRELFKWMEETYQFAKVPSSPLDLDDSTKSLAFLFGRFKVGNDFVAVELRIYNDGFAANTQSSTDDSEAFLKEALNATVKKFSLSFETDIIKRKLYFSELNIRCERPLTALNPKLKNIATKISSLAGVQKESSFDLCGLSFWHDPKISSPLSLFRFEKKANTPASENSYFSCAPLKTEDHISVLNDLEKLLA
jgi:hypothetical protein